MAFDRNRFGDFLNTYLGSYLAGQRQKESQAAELQRQTLANLGALTNSLMEGVKSNPDLANRLRERGITQLGGMPIDVFAASPEDALAGGAKDIESASDLSHLPTDQGIETSYLARPGAVKDNRAPIEQLLKEAAARRAQLMASMTPTAVNDVNPTSGLSQTEYVNPMQLTGRTFSTQATPSQTGANKGAEALAAQPGTTKADIASINAEAGPKARAAGLQAGSMAGATAAAQAPYQKPDILYGDNGDDATGVKWNPKTKSYDQVQLPPGLSKVPHKLSAAQVQQIASLNTAEIEGVKVLTDMHKSELDKSNDPIDPRWRKFVATKLGMASGDVTLDNDQQRTAFVNAVMTRGLMGARPSQYVAELFQQHLPSGQMTGAKLAQVMKDTMEQMQEIRDNTAAVSHAQVAAPTGGMTYKQFLDVLSKEPPDALTTGRAKLGGR